MIDSNVAFAPGPNRTHNGMCLTRAQDNDGVALERCASQPQAVGGQQTVATSTGAIAAVSPRGSVSEGPPYAACAVIGFNLSSSMTAARHGGATKLQTQQCALPLSFESCQRFSLGLLHVPNEATAASPTKVCFCFVFPIDIYIYIYMGSFITFAQLMFVISRP